MSVLLTRKELERKIAPSFTPAQTTALIDVLDNVHAFQTERAADTRALKAGQQALTEKVGVLADKIGVLTDKVGALAEAQGRTEARVDTLTDKVGALADAQARTDSRIEALVEAQARTDSRIEALVEAQARTDSRIQALVEAQARTEATMERGFADVWGAISALTTQVSNLGQQVGSMVNTFGFSLEEYTAALLPPYIERHFGVADVALAQAHFPGAGGAPEEIDLTGRGVREGEVVAVFAEVKTSIGGTEARRLADKLDSVAEASAVTRSLKLIVAMNIHPSAVEAIAGRDITLVPYSRINRDRG